MGHGRDSTTSTSELLLWYYQSILLHSKRTVVQSSRVCFMEICGKLVKAQMTRLGLSIYLMLAPSMDTMN